MLAVAFIHLKLSGAIAWSWVWVLSPLWGYFIATVLIVTPVRALWLQTWWSPFAFWLSMIAVIALLHRRDHAA